MVVDKKLAEKRLFWKTLFETEKLASQMVSLAKTRVNGIALELPNFGQVRVKAVAASTLGDNFMSDTFIVTAFVAPRNLDSDTTIYKTFVKVLPSNLPLRQAAYESQAHHREIEMYATFFDILRELDPTQSVPLDVANSYYVHLEEMVKGGADGSGTCIALEDLKSEGFVMSDKIAGADYKHCRLALTSLAHYHALTLTAVRRWFDPSTGRCSKAPPGAAFVFGKSMFDTGGIPMMKTWASTLIDFANDVKRPDLVDWLSGSIERFEEIMQIDDLRSSGKLACILHGDFWNNNMLFKYEADENDPNGKPVPVALRLVDFQIARVGHPLGDILYFLYSSATPETRENHMQELLRHYFDTLMADTQLLGVKIQNYTFEDFVAEYKNRALASFFIGAMAMSVILNKEVVTTMQNLDKEKQAQGPKPVSDAEQEMGASGMSVEVEETMKTMMGSHRHSSNQILTGRLLRLIMEVHALVNS